MHSQIRSRKAIFFQKMILWDVHKVPLTAPTLLFWWVVVSAYAYEAYIQLTTNNY